MNPKAQQLCTAERLAQLYEEVRAQNSKSADQYYSASIDLSNSLWPIDDFKHHAYLPAEQLEKFIKQNQKILAGIGLELFVDESDNSRAVYKGIDLSPIQSLKFRLTDGHLFSVFLSSLSPGTLSEQSRLALTKIFTDCLKNSLLAVDLSSDEPYSALDEITIHAQPLLSAFAKLKLSDLQNLTATWIEQLKIGSLSSALILEHLELIPSTRSIEPPRMWALDSKRVKSKSPGWEIAIPTECSEHWNSALKTLAKLEAADTHPSLIKKSLSYLLAELEESLSVLRNSPEDYRIMDKTTSKRLIRILIEYKCLLFNLSGADTSPSFPDGI